MPQGCPWKTSYKMSYEQQGMKITAGLGKLAQAIQLDNQLAQPTARKSL